MFTSSTNDRTEKLKLEEVRKLKEQLKRLPEHSLTDLLPVKTNVIDAAHIARQIAFSEATYGPGERTAGVIDHIKKELKEAEKDPTDVEEWADIIILAIDGAWRAGAEPQHIIDAVIDKQTKNEGRTWPDWRTAEAGKAIEHIRD